MEQSKTDDLKPTQIGPFQVLGVLGRGGQGEVLRAENEEGLHVAIKTLQYRSVDRLRELRHEAQILERLEHPYVVRVLGYDFSAQTPWYAMELVEGWSLHDILYGTAEGVETSVMPAHMSSPLRQFSTKEVTVDADASQPGADHSQVPLQERDTEKTTAVSFAPTVHQLRALEVIAALCNTLSFVHGEGVVHCDLKPANVVLGPDGYPVLVDFGLSGRFANNHRESIDIGRAIAGTAHYMSPEQIEGKRVDARADLYAIGCILYEIVTGSPPFCASSGMAVMVMHLGERPPKPSVHVPWARGVLDDLIMSLLVRDPTRRLGFADEVRTRIIAFLGQTLTLRATSSLPKARRYLYRAPLIGREAEFESVRDVLYETLQKKTPHIVRVEGLVGSGKTRFAQEVVQAARSKGTAVSVMRCRERASTFGVFSAFLKMVSDVLSTEPEPFVTVSVQTLRVLAQFDPELARTLEQHNKAPIPPPIPLDARNTQQRLTDALHQVLNALANSKPLLLVLDDLHWMDEVSAQTIAGLARSLEDTQAPWMILALEREQHPTTTTFWGALGVEPSAAFRFGPLDRQDTFQVVRGMMASHDVDEDFLEIVYQKSSGNPFFMSQVLEFAIERNMVQRTSEGIWSFQDPNMQRTSTLPIPSQLVDFLQTRILSLDPVTRKVLHTLAVFQSGCSDDVLHAATGLARKDFLYGLRGLLRARLLEPEAFSKRILAGALSTLVLERFDNTARCELYARAAHALESFGQEPKDRELSHLWFCADEPQRALPYTRAIFQHAFETYQQGVMEHEGALLLKYSDDPAIHAYVLSSLAYRVHAPRGHYEKSLQAWGKAASYARSHEDWEQLAVICSQWADAARLHGDRPESIALCIEGAEAGERVSAVEPAIKCLCIHARLLAAHGDQKSAHELFQRGISLCEKTADWSLFGHILHVQALVRWSAGKRQEALRILEQSTRKLRDEEAHIDRLAHTIGRLAGLKRELGLIDEAHEHHKECIALHKRAGNLVEEAIARGNYATTLTATGQFREALKQFDAMIPVVRQADCRPALAFALSTRASTCFELGLLDNVLADLYAAARLQEEAHSLLYMAYTFFSIARVELIAYGEVDRATAIFDRAEAVMQRIDSPYEKTFCVCFRVHFILAQGDLVQAREKLARAEELRQQYADEFGPEIDEVFECARLSLEVAEKKGLEFLRYGVDLSTFTPELRRALKTSLKRPDGVG